ncbi:MAG TPA: DUF4190 domain-containing protein [Firmicutes bacterium]|nr:DUF4190 domain-containing protein [Bacillota bacterium]
MGKRYVADFNTGKPDDFIQFVSEDFLRKEGFAPATVKGEAVWKKGKGLLAAPQFLKLQYAGGMVHLEAWLKYAVLPGVYCGEMGLDGAMAFAVKAALRNKVNALVALLYQPVNIPVQPAGAPAENIPAEGFAGSAPAAGPAVGVAPSYGEAVSAVPQPSAAPCPSASAAPAAYAAQPGPAYPPAPIPVAVHNPTGKATLSLIMGLCSILGCFVPLAGVITGVIGIPIGLVGRKTTARGMATAGLALSIVFLIVSVLNWIAGIVLMVML